MKRNVQVALAFAAALAFTPTADAQQRGRTDGPENSEWGKGGYVSLGGGRVSLGIDWGAALPASTADIGPPIFVGATFGYWHDEWIVLDVAGQYRLNTGDSQIHVGPRFRFGDPVAVSVGIKAGGYYEQATQSLAFSVSPQVALELTFDPMVLALGFALDLPFGPILPSNRVFMHLGYRF